MSNLPRVPLDKLQLYYFESCPYCLMVRSVMDRLGLKIELKNIRKSEEAYQQLIIGGGNQMVPCLRIELPDGKVFWLYESTQIVAYLKRHYS